MTTPTVIEKQMVDIDLSGGMDESIPEESVDWTKRLVKAQNVVVDGNGLKTRDGVRRVGSGVTIGRLGQCKGGGIAAICNDSSNLYLNQLEEGKATPTLLAKDRIPNFVVTSKTVSASPALTASTSSDAEQAYVAAYAVINFTKYQVLIHSLPNAVVAATVNMCAPFRVVVVDRTSGNVVRTWNFPTAASPATSLSIGDNLIPTAVGVDDRYVHLYVSKANDFGGTGGFKPKMTVIDTQSLPTNITGLNAATWTDITSSAVGDRIAGVVPVTNGSVVVTQGTTCRIEKFNNSRTSVSASTVANIQCTGVDTTNGSTAGTTYYLVGFKATSGDLVYKEVSAAYAVTRSVDGPTMSTMSDTAEVSIASDGAGGARMVSKTASSSGTVYCPIVYSIAAGDVAWTTLGYLPNWLPASVPIYVNGMYLIHMHNQMPGDYVANCDAIVNITSTLTGNVPYPRVFRPEAVLGNYTTDYGAGGAAFTIFDGVSGESRDAGPLYKPYLNDDTYPGVVAFAHWSKLDATSTSPQSYSIDVLERQASNSKRTIDQDTISGGILCSYDGSRVSEFGFITAPSCTVAASGSSGVDAGTYNYVVVFSYTDAQGRVHRSRVSRPASVTIASAKTITITATVPTVSMRGHDFQISIYRTLSGGTQYFLLIQKQLSTLVGTATNPDAEIFVTKVDGTLDADIEDNPLLYRQPGTIGTPLDRYHGLSANHVIHHKDRIFYCNGSNVYYSSFEVDGEAPWFNPALSFAVQGGSGDLVGLASMDGILVCFKRDGIFVVDGDGPSESGGNGTEFSPPRKIHTEFGCIDPRTILATPSGIMYRSPRGIDLLNRKLQVEFIGERVYRSVDACNADPNVYGGGAAFDRTSGMAYFPMATSGGVYTVFCYDFINNAWTKNVYFQGSTGSDIYDVCYAYSVNAAGTKGNYMYFASGLNGLMYGDTVNSIDYLTTDVFVPWDVETGWIKSPSKQDRIRVTDLLFLGQRQTNFNLKCQFYANYNRSTVATIKTWTASDTNLTPVQVVFQPNREEVQAMKFKITTETPTVSTTIGTGKQVDMIGLTVRVGLKGGGAKIAAAQNG